MKDLQKIKELDAQNYMPTFNRQNICFDRGDKNILFDTNGKEYIDFVSGIGCNSLGYNNPLLVEAISKQSAKLMQISNLYYTAEQAELCDKLLSGTIFDKVFLSNSGAEANECAIKMVRKYFNSRGENKCKILSALGSFHGRTLATATLTGQTKYSQPFAPLPDGFGYVPYNDFEALKNAMTDDVGAIMLECIQGENGVYPANYDYLVGAYALAKSRGVLFLVDEVQTGMGRTGKFFAFENYGIQPDIVTLAKNLGAGVPMGATLARGEIAMAFHPGDHGTTFGGNPLACASSMVITSLLKDTDLLAEITKKGEYLIGKLSKLSKYHFVKEIRGMGLMAGIELAPVVLSASVVGKCATKGLLINGCGHNTLRLLPPYTIEYSEIDTLVTALESIFSEINV